MNNRLALFFMGLFSLLFISACQTPAMTEEQNNANSASKSVEMLAKECLAKGGEYTKEGRLQAYRCVQQFSDAGKSCSDSSECQGKCTNSDTAIEAGKTNVKGTCAANDTPFGCRQTIEGGVAKGFLCVD
ncbi:MULTISPECIES: hypothetical protein [Psychrobacter]|uniref:Lipoprotein n=1 Tax=Psychrobacter alimentarius TaxID=261164 RepID=A0ABM5ZYC4_9GAMM|nr:MULTISPECIES: hypothetical protein [Psychrobacter]AMT97006.1 hypothetical protein A3K91_1402 [Psychrobacter alimentarius]QCB30646.1 hypothetical protein E5677_06375 [Psychrobacter sp. PAMC27889]